jgi:hypothetical protein
LLVLSVMSSPYPCGEIIAARRSSLMHGSRLFQALVTPDD